MSSFCLGVLSVTQLHNRLDFELVRNYSTVTFHNCFRVDYVMLNNGGSISRVLAEDHCKEGPAISQGEGKLARNSPKIDQLLSNSVYKILPWRFYVVFLLPRARAKSGSLDIDQELDMGCQLLTRTFPCWNCRGLSGSGPLASPNRHKIITYKNNSEKDISKHYGSHA